MSETLTTESDEANIGPLADPLAGWPNDDLLLSEASRARWRELEPAMLTLLDWPELRAEFARHETLANAARALNLRLGITTLCLSGAGLLLAALAPLTKPQQAAIHLVAELSLIAGFTLGLLHLLWARPKSRWLLHRFWTERIRQFYFQFLLNNIDLASDAIGDRRARTRFVAERQRTLALFLSSKMHDAAYRLDRLVADKAEMSPWIDAAWEHAAPVGEDNPQRRALIAVLGRQRISIQLEYCRKKLRRGFHSPETRAEIVAGIADMLTGGVVILGIIIGAMLALGHEHSAWLARAAVASALFSATILLLRVLDQGLQLSVDAERFGWYLAAVEALNARFEHAPTLDAKVAALREVEHLSYQELRRFIVAHKNARFLL